MRGNNWDRDDSLVTEEEMRARQLKDEWIRRIERKTTEIECTSSGDPRQQVLKAQRAICILVADVLGNSLAMREFDNAQLWTLTSTRLKSLEIFVDCGHMRHSKENKFTSSGEPARGSGAEARKSTVTTPVGRKWQLTQLLHHYTACLERYDQKLEGMAVPDGADGRYADTLRLSAGFYLLALCCSRALFANESFKDCARWAADLTRMLHLREHLEEYMGVNMHAALREGL